MQDSFQGNLWAKPVAVPKRLKLQEARQLLMIKGSYAARIAEQVGYESVSHFTRDYKKLFGVPPATDSLRKKLSQIE
ncbi:helix-turn-helix domain-containing protein [Enterobacter ludwigii]